MEETLYLLLLVAKKNRKSVDIQNNKGKVKILINMMLKISQAKLAMINDKQYDLLKLLQTPFFYARTPKMTLLLSLLSDPSIIDRKNHTVLESCIKLVVFSSNNTNLLSRMNLSYSISGIIHPVLKLFFPPECRQTTRSSVKRASCWFTTSCESHLIKPLTR